MSSDPALGLAKFARQVLMFAKVGTPVSMEDVSFQRKCQRVMGRAVQIMGGGVEVVSGIPIGNTALWTVPLLLVLVAGVMLSLGIKHTTRQKHAVANQHSMGTMKGV